MARRKQAAPKAHLGRIEDREEGGEAVAPTAHDNDNEALLEAEEEWEAEQEAREGASRRRKRHRRAVAPAAAAASGTPVAVGPTAKPWCFGVVQLDATGTAQATADAETVHVEVAASDADGTGEEEIQLRLQGASWQGSASVSAAAADALQRLLRSKHVVAGLEASGGQPIGLCLSLGERALGDAAGWAEDPQLRAWQRQLLALLQWLQPSLDPEQEIEVQGRVQGTAADELLASPLCSPHKGGAGPGSPTLAASATPGSPCGLAAGAQQVPASFDAAEVYAAVRPSGREPELDEAAVGSALLPQLRHYQRRAALWMIKREQQGGQGRQQEQRQQRGQQEQGGAGGDIKQDPVDGSSNDIGRGSSDQQQRQQQQKEEEMEEEEEEREQHPPQPLHPLWREVPCIVASSSSADSSGDSSSGSEPGGSSFYINPWTGCISLEHFPAPPPAKGGILSEEMGLGEPQGGGQAWAGV